MRNLKGILLLITAYPILIVVMVLSVVYSLWLWEDLSHQSLHIFNRILQNFELFHKKHFRTNVGIAYKDMPYLPINPSAYKKYMQELLG